MEVIYLVAMELLRLFVHLSDVLLQSFWVQVDLQ